MVVMVFAFKCSAIYARELASSRVLLLKFREYVMYVQTTQLRSMPMQDATMVLAADVHTYIHVCPKPNAYMVTPNAAANPE